jgi:hypothetical protein
MSFNNLLKDIRVPSLENSLYAISSTLAEQYLASIGLHRRIIVLIK